MSGENFGKSVRRYVRINVRKYCQKSGRMSGENFGKSVRRYVRINVRRYCQKICQKNISERVSDTMSGEKVRRYENVRRYVTDNVRRSATKNIRRYCHRILSERMSERM